MGFALGRDGGALEALARLAKLGLGGTVGNGRQYISWLHIADLNRMILESIESSGAAPATVVGSYTYDPFGAITVNSGTAP